MLAEEIGGVEGIEGIRGELKESGELKELEESEEQKSPLREQRALRYRGGRNHFSLSARRLRAATISSSAFAAPVQ